MISADGRHEGSFDGRNVLYVGQLADVVLPLLPNIPAEEGIHCLVTSGHDASDTPRQVASRYLLGLGAAKVIAESGVTVDAWANTRLEAGGNGFLFMEERRKTPLHGASPL